MQDISSLSTLVFLEANSWLPCLCPMQDLNSALVAAQYFLALFAMCEIQVNIIISKLSDSPLTWPGPGPGDFFGRIWLNSAVAQHWWHSSAQFFWQCKPAWGKSLNNYLCTQTEFFR